jgi:transcriptional regulator with PAS, ATPase and Fis domain
LWAFAGRPGIAVTSVQTITNKGKKRRVVLSGHPIFNPARKVSLVITFVRDITLMANLREQITAQRELIGIHQQTMQMLSSRQNDLDEFTFCSHAMQNIIQMAKKIAITDAIILIMGETGVGKGVFAKKIHAQSLRNKQPFFTVDCTSIPENLFESELFGYAPGAFSGAQSKGKPGLFEMADKGTLFLDEIGELPIAMQPKLLRVLQDQEIMRVGSTHRKKVDVRIIAATNKNLQDEVRTGKFRSDLFYRLSVVTLEIPPLRDRKDAILIMVNHFLNKFNQKYKKNISFSKDCKKYFHSYSWPGNTRQLENMIHQLVITHADRMLTPNDLPTTMTSLSILPAPGSLKTFSINHTHQPLKKIMAEIENKILQEALDVYGSINEVAHQFSVNRTTIVRKMKRNMHQRTK